MKKSLWAWIAFCWIALLIAVPISAQYLPSPEPQARRDAAVLDFFKSCAAEFDLFSRNYVIPAHYAGPGWTHQLEAERIFVDSRTPPGEHRYRAMREVAPLAPVDMLRGNLAQSRPIFAGNPNERNRLVICSMEVALRHALEGIPGYDHGVGRGSAAAPAPKPKAAPKATPKAAAIPGKFPPARAAKSAPWSPKAMPTEYGVKPKALDPRFAAERADALASCQGPIQQYGSRFGLNAAEANVTIETEVLYDATMEMTPAPIKAHLARFDQMIASGTLSPEAAAFGRCVLSRRIAQLEGSPLIAGAVDGTLNPFSIGSPGTQWKQQGKDARVIASDGKSAMHCVKLEPIASGDSALSGGGRRFFNYCPEAVEIVWCHAPGDCYGPIGSAWTVRPNHGWPVSSKGYVRWAACLGANTASFVKGSYGLRYYCSAPAKTK